MTFHSAHLRSDCTLTGMRQGVALQIGIGEIKSYYLFETIYAQQTLGWHADCKLTAQRTSIVHLFSAQLVAVTCE